MTRLLSLITLSLALLGTGLVPAHAQTTHPIAVSPDDALAVQAVVRAQLAAFATDDADQAFAYASPALRQQFGNAAQFIRMVRGTYPVVYRPQAVVFLKPEPSDDELVQPVHMTDQDGTTWLAVYRLQRQQDRSWRIGGCVLLPRAGKTV